MAPRGRTAAVLGLAALLAAAGAALLVGAADRTLRRSEPYRLALERLRSDPRAARELGAPMVARGFATSRSFRTADLRSARLSFGVAGPRGEARVEAHAHRRDGRWSLDALWLHRPPAPPLALVGERPPRPAP
ncbi:MAG: cytochrome c oxidase assembly factor Coa1 family protein [Vicinamibacteria bacterium]|nr:cytochrome c oxidase assembly factor Coa1 family protein [Vicinamibacteria bacterium]